MLKIIEFGKHIVIACFKNVEIRDAEETIRTINDQKPAGVDLQFFDASRIATWQHLYFAALNALTAFGNKRNISKTLSMEIMLYASGQNQIEKATQLIGIKSAPSTIAVLAVGDSLDAVKSVISIASRRICGQLDDSVLELSDAKVRAIREVFGIRDPEVEAIMRRHDEKKAVVDLIVERMALLATKG